MIKTTLIYTLFFCIFASNVFADGLPEDARSDVYRESSSTKSSAKASEGSSVALKPEILVKYQYCGKDSDCVAVINGCCQCLQGDSFVAVAKDMLEAYQSNFKCDNYQCPKEESYKNCDHGVVSCINHKCSYFTVAE